MPVFTGNWFGFGRNPATTAGATTPGAALFPDDIASGGYIECTDPGLVRHVFTAPGQFTVGPDHPGTIAFFVVGGGGGGGGAHHGGGGGGGAILSDPSHPVPATNYPIVIGTGGGGGKGNNNASGVGGNGFNSSAFGATAEGGGGGGCSHPAGQGNAGGSGGGCGGSGAPNNPGPAVNPTPGPAQYAGNAGGSNSGDTGPWYGSAGGGGGSQAGKPNGNPGPNNRAGNGGNGAPLPDAMSAIGGDNTGWVSSPTDNPGSMFIGGGGGGATYNSGSSVGLARGGKGGGGPGGQATNVMPAQSQGGYGCGNNGRTWFGCGGGGGERQGVGGGHGGDGMCVISYTLPGPASGGFIDDRGPVSKLIVATGGIIHECQNPNGYSIDRVHAFSSCQNLPQPTAGDAAQQQFKITSAAPSQTIELLLVGGGGGGGWKGGGGGAGEVVHHPGIPVSAPHTFLLKVGRGGVGDMMAQAETGGNESCPGTVSVFGPPTAAETWGAGGGGRGGSDDTTRSGGDGYNGGSGGGCAGGGYDPSQAQSGSAGSNPYPNPGASTYAQAGGPRQSPGPDNGPTFAGAGGGGASPTGQGGGSGDNGGAGGAGRQFPTFTMWGTNSSNAIGPNLFGSRGYFAGGGGGGGDNAPVGTGGVGGGATGAAPTTGVQNPSPKWNTSNQGWAGLQATGGGGGGGSDSGQYSTGGDGGDGIVLIRYKYID